jgi:hypothetical protein
MMHSTIGNKICQTTGMSSMHAKLLAGVILLATATIHQATATPPEVPPDASVPPMDDGRDLPGKTRGRGESYWLAPYVRVSAGTYGPANIVWLTQGETREPRDFATVETFDPSYAIAKSGEGEDIILGINEEWKITLPGTAKRRPTIQGTPDSRIILVQHPVPSAGPVGPFGDLMVDIYHHGKLASTRGPFLRYRGNAVKLGADGATALKCWKDESKTQLQLVLTNSEGKQSARIDCEETDEDYFPGPNGLGALVREKEDRYDYFDWYTAGGKKSVIKIGPGPHFLGWVPGTLNSLFSTGADEAPHYHLIDCAKGTALWTTERPGFGEMLSHEVTPRLIVLEMAELYRPGPWRGNDFLLRRDGTEWIRCFYTLCLADGHVISHWQAKAPRRLENTGHDHFLRLGAKLYFITAEEFVELSEDDMLNGKDGWELLPRPTAK